MIDVRMTCVGSSYVTNRFLVNLNQLMVVYVSSYSMSVLGFVWCREEMVDRWMGD